MLRCTQLIAKTTTTTIAVLLLLISCNGADVNTIVGSGNVKTETRKIDGTFTKISANRGLDVVVIQADQQSVVVEADDNLLGNIETKLDGNTLVITTKYNSFSNVASKKITVKLPKIEGIEAQSGSNVRTTASLRSEDLNLTTSSGGTLVVTVEADDLTAEASSGSNMEISGKALSLKTDASSGSTIKAGSLMANEVSSEASSGSSTTVNPIVQLKGNASSGGSIRYTSDPKSFSKEESSGGSVSKE